MVIGSVKAVPRPGSKVMEEALSLLSAFGKEEGGNKELLEEMKAVQIHNEEIYKQITAGIQENSQLVAESKQLNSVDRQRIREEIDELGSRALEFQKQEDKLNQRESALEDEESQFAIERSNAEGRINQREESLRKRERIAEQAEIATEKSANQAEALIEATLGKTNRLKALKEELLGVLRKLDEV